MKKNQLIIERIWDMPNKETFSIYPIRKLLEQNMRGVSCDPFARNSNVADYRNDIDPDTTASYHMDALDFLRQFEDDFFDCVLFDPPYSPRQVSECYKRLGKTVNMKTTQSSFWSKIKDEIARVLKVGGVAICFGWNSQGISKSRGFKMTKILLIHHGGMHNDTICTVEEKIQL